MNDDIRLSTTFFQNRKTKKLERILGEHGVLCLLKLWSRVATEKPCGLLKGWSSDDIEIEAGFNGEPGEFTKALIDVGFVDQNEYYSLHNWESRQAWVVNSQDRSDKARLTRMAKTHNAIYKQLVNDGYTGVTREHYNELTKVKLPVNVALTPAPAPKPDPDPDPDPKPDPKPNKKDTTVVLSEKEKILNLKPIYFSKEQWRELYSHRTKRKATQTVRAYLNLISEFDKANLSGMSADEILNAMSTGKGWAGFKLEWVRNMNSDQIKPRTVSDANAIRKEEMCGRLLEGVGGLFDENEQFRIDR